MRLSQSLSVRYFQSAFPDKDIEYRTGDQCSIGWQYNTERYEWGYIRIPGEYSWTRCRQTYSQDKGH